MDPPFPRSSPTSSSSSTDQRQSSSPFRERLSDGTPAHGTTTTSASSSSPQVRLSTARSVLHRLSDAVYSETQATTTSGARLAALQAEHAVDRGEIHRLRKGAHQSKARLLGQDMTIAGLKSELEAARVRAAARSSVAGGRVARTALRHLTGRIRTRALVAAFEQWRALRRIRQEIVRRLGDHACGFVGRRRFRELALYMDAWRARVRGGEAGCLQSTSCYSPVQCFGLFWGLASSVRSHTRARASRAWSHAHDPND